LEKDLDMFEAGDETEVGEKGLTLRWVSKQLYRAIKQTSYSPFPVAARKPGSLLLVRSILEVKPFSSTTFFLLWTFTRLPGLLINASVATSSRIELSF
jgi:hypothetical protein